MSTQIEWTDETWNPVTGCTRCSAGCEHCYAARMAHRLQAMGCSRYAEGFSVAVHRDLFDRPFTRRKSRRVFVNSMGDLFHEAVPTEDILEIFSVMNQLPQHTFQVLTKRIQRVLALDNLFYWTPNIWLGVTVENQAVLPRVEFLKRTGAHIKFVSAEPLLESLKPLDVRGLDWLIVGGESGPSCRRMDQSWVLELLEMARAESVPFFFKQWGGTQRKKGGCTLLGHIIQEYPSQVQRS